MELPLHRELVYQELQTDLEKAIQDNPSAIFQKIKQGVPTDNFYDAIPTAWGTVPSDAGSASDVLREQYPSGISFGVIEGTLQDDSGVVSGTAIPSHTSGDHETEDGDVMIVSTTPAPECQVLAEMTISWRTRGSKPAETAPSNIFGVPFSEQTCAVDTIQTIMDDEDKSRVSATEVKAATTILAPVLAATMAS